MGNGTNMVAVLITQGMNKCIDFDYLEHAVPLQGGLTRSDLSQKFTDLFQRFSIYTLHKGSNPSARVHWPLSESSTFQWPTRRYWVLPLRDPTTSQLQRLP